MSPSGICMRRTYLDHAATTPLDPAVLEEMMPFFVEKFGNSSSIHSFGQEAGKAIDEARERVSALIGAKKDEIYFTGSGTEANNMAVLGTANLKENKGCHIITTAIEHPAVLSTVKYLETQGFEATYLPVGADGIVEPQVVADSIRPSTKLISIIHANN
jgi:cysteine desulfurase